MLLAPVLVGLTVIGQSAVHSATVWTCLHCSNELRKPLCAEQSCHVAMLLSVYAVVNSIECVPSPPARLLP